MKKIRVAVVGVGFVGLLHIEALRRLGNVEVVAICDSFDASKRGKNLFIENTYSDYKLITIKQYIDIKSRWNSYRKIKEYEYFVFQVTLGFNVLFLSNINQKIGFLDQITLQILFNFGVK